MITTIIQSLNAIPSGAYTVVAAIAASLIAYFGVWHSLREHTKRERVDRETNMRREVFFAAAEAISRADSYVQRFGDLNLTDTEHREYVKSLGPSVAKIHIVARLATIERFIHFIHTHPIA